MSRTPFAGPEVQGEIKFSVLIPAHNEEKYITKCLQSISAAAQPFPDQVWRNTGHD